MLDFKRHIFRGCRGLGRSVRHIHQQSASLKTGQVPLVDQDLNQALCGDLLIGAGNQLAKLFQDSRLQKFLGFKIIDELVSIHSLQPREYLSGNRSLAAPMHKLLIPGNCHQLYLVHADQHAGIQRRHN